MVDLPYNPLISYCTSWFDSIHFGPINWDWGVCCYYHDLAYEHLLDKTQADWELATCVTHATGLFGIPIAALMLLGVSTAGVLYYIRAILKARSGG